MGSGMGLVKFEVLLSDCNNRSLIMAEVEVSLIILIQVGTSFSFQVGHLEDNAAKRKERLAALKRKLAGEVNFIIALNIVTAFKIPSSLSLSSERQLFDFWDHAYFFPPIGNFDE